MFSHLLHFCALILVLFIFLHTSTAESLRYKKPIVVHNFPSEQKSDPSFASNSEECEKVLVRFVISDTIQNYSLSWIDENGHPIFSESVSEDRGAVHHSCSGHSFLLQPNHVLLPTHNLTWVKVGSDKNQLFQTGPFGACFSVTVGHVVYDDFLSVDNSFFGSLLPILHRLNQSATSTSAKLPRECPCSTECRVANESLLPPLKTAYESGDDLLVQALQIFLQECPDPIYQRAAHGMMGHMLLRKYERQGVLLASSIPHLWTAFQLGDPGSQSTMALLSGVVGSTILVDFLQKANETELPKTSDEMDRVLHASLRCAANSGDASAQAALGFRFLHGLDSEEKDCKRAAESYKKAADQALTGEPLRRLVFEVDHDDPAQRWKQIEIPTDEKVLLMDLAAQGDRKALFQIGERYLFGENGFEQDFDQAAHFFNQAAEQGYPIAVARQGLMLWHGMGMKANVTEARDKYFKRACNLGWEKACSDYAFLLSFGAPFEQKNYTKALRYFHMAANKSVPDAHFHIGEMYALGLGVPQDDVAAFRHFNISAVGGQFNAMEKVAWMFYKGIGTNQSCPAAVRFWKRVVDSGPLRIGLEDARRHFLAKQFEHSMIHYGLMAEKGFLNAQKNAAWLSTSAYISQTTGDVPQWLNARSTEERFYRMATHQNDSKSMLRLADVFFERWLESHQNKNNYDFESNNALLDGCSVGGNETCSLLNIGQAIWLEQSIQLYESVANKSVGEGYFSLAYLHFKGYGFHQSYETATDLLHKAFECYDTAFFPSIVALIGIHCISRFHFMFDFCSEILNSSLIFHLVRILQSLPEDSLLCFLILFLLLMVFYYRFKTRS